MRVMLKVTIPVESGNAAAKAGTLGSTILSILEVQKPEAAYFTDDHGKRCGFLFLDLKDASGIPAIAEPWMLALNASIQLRVVMVPQDLARAAGAIETAAKVFG